MNNRIKEFAEQAKRYVDDQWAKEGSKVYPEAHYRYMQERDQKFAELIVKASVKHLSDCNCEFEAEQLEEFWNDE